MGRNSAHCTVQFRFALVKISHSNSHLDLLLQLADRRLLLLSCLQCSNQSVRPVTPDTSVFVM